MKGAEKGTFSALDALWILLGVALLVLLFLFLLPTLGKGGETYEVRYVLRVRDVDPLMVGEDAESLIPPGSGVYSENGAAALGRVERVESAPQMRARVTAGDSSSAGVSDCSAVGSSSRAKTE